MKREGAQNPRYIRRFLRMSQMAAGGLFHFLIDLQRKGSHAEKGAERVPGAFRFIA